MEGSWQELEPAGTAGAHESSLKRTPILVASDLRVCQSCRSQSLSFISELNTHLRPRSQGNWRGVRGMCAIASLEQPPPSEVSQQRRDVREPPTPAESLASVPREPVLWPALTRNPGEGPSGKCGPERLRPQTSFTFLTIIEDPTDLLFT